MAYTFDKANADAPSKRTTQYFEMFGNRGIYHDGWYRRDDAAGAAVAAGHRASCPTCRRTTSGNSTTSTEDYSQFNDLAAKKPDKLKEMQELFLVEAAKYQVFPLDNSILPRLLTPRPSATAGRTVFTYTGENAGIPVGNAPSILNKDYTITAEVDVPEGGAEGMIATMGGRFGGYGLYLLKGKPVFVYNLLDLKRFRWEGGVGGATGWARAEAGQAHHRVRLQVRRPGLRQGRHRRAVGGRQGAVAKQTDPAHHSVPDVDRRDASTSASTPARASTSSYQLPFRFTGTIDKLTYKLGKEQLAEADRKVMQEALARARD